MMHLKFVEKLKPQQIAKKLRCSVTDVYKADFRLKRNLKRSASINK